MNAPLRHTDLNLDCTYWTVLCDGEGHTFSSRQEAAHNAASTFGVPFKVIEWNVAENTIHDVTLDFLPDDEPDDDFEDLSMRRHIATFSRPSGY